jgi:hypothetical protein
MRFLLATVSRQKAITCCLIRSIVRIRGCNFLSVSPRFPLRAKLAVFRKFPKPAIFIARFSVRFAMESWGQHHSPSGSGRVPRQVIAGLAMRQRPSCAPTFPKT